MNTSGLSLRAGDTFMTTGSTIPDHLWVVLSDPLRNAEKIVLVNFTSYEFDKDESCVLEVGDHPFIRHKTIINYARAEIASIEELSTLHNTNQIQLREPVKDDILSRIRNGMMKSPHSKRGFKRILRDQGLVDSN